MHALMERNGSRCVVRSDRRFVRSLMLSAAAAGLGLASTAFAGFSTVQTPLTGNESQTGLLDNIYGGSFVLEDGVDYSNGTLTAVRVSDTLPNTSTLSYTNPGPNATDQLWTASSLTATVKYSHAEDVSTPFGYIPGSSGGTFTSLFGVTGGTFSVSGTGSFSPSGTFRLAAENTYGVLSSSPSDNADGKDHMITYQINGLPDGSGADTWLVAFTDYGNAGTGSSEDAYYDFQNLVVQLQTNPASSSTPEPGSLMVIGGVALALLKRAPRRAR